MFLTNLLMYKHFIFVIKLNKYHLFRLSSRFFFNRCNSMFETYAISFIISNGLIQSQAKCTNGNPLDSSSSLTKEFRQFSEMVLHLDWIYLLLCFSLSYNKKITDFVAVLPQNPNSICKVGQLCCLAINTHYAFLYKFTM